MIGIVIRVIEVVSLRMFVSYILDTLLAFAE